MISEMEMGPEPKPWIMSVKKTAHPTEFAFQTEFLVYIGAVKVAEIAFHRAGKWKCFMRLFGFDIRDYESMSDALKDLHELLQSPPPGDQYESEVSDAD